MARPGIRTRDRILLTAAWMVAAWLFFRYWDLTIRAEALLVWSAVFTALFLLNARVAEHRGLAAGDGVNGAVALWAALALGGSLVGLTFPLVPIGSSQVQTVALLRVFDLIVPIWILLRGVHRIWEGPTAVAITASVPVLLVGMIWSQTVRMPGESHSGPIPPPTAEESELASRLRSHVVMLADSIGIRGSRHPEAVARSVTWIDGALREIGYMPTHLPFDVSGHTEINLEVTVPGASRPDEIIVVGAHYDTHPLTPGADDNASGVAGVLELARMMVDTAPERTIRFVFFATEEPPWFNTVNMGSRAYAMRAREADDDIVVMISLETIGYFSDEPGSQRYPPPFSLFYPDRGDFIGIVGNPATGQLTRQALRIFRGTTALPSEGATPSSLVPSAELSDHASFWKEGYRAMMITNTAPFRNAHYHELSDTPETLDFDRMARVVTGTREILRELAGG